MMMMIILLYDSFLTFYSLIIVYMRLVMFIKRICYVICYDDDDDDDDDDYNYSMSDVWEIQPLAFFRNVVS